MYTTLAELTDRYGAHMLVSLTDRAAMATGLIDTTVVDRALVDADAMIDGYLAVRYALPLSSVPTLVADLAQAIAIYKLHVTSPDPKIKDDYDGALRSLRDISNGALRLSVAGIEPDTAATGSGVAVSDRERVLTTDTMGGFV